MFGGIDATDRIAVALYFLLFVVLMLIIGANLYIGIICDAFTVRVVGW